MVDWSALKWRRAPLYIVAFPLWAIAMILYEIILAGEDLTDWLTTRRQRGSSS